MVTNKRKACCLTTTDNPYNPFTQWRLWLDYDTVRCGYFTCERIASIAAVSDYLTDEENEPELQRAYDIIIKNGAINRYGKKVDYVRVYEP